jgi:hypothetical protein
MAAFYARRANQKILAMAAMEKIEAKILHNQKDETQKLPNRPEKTVQLLLSKPLNSDLMVGMAGFEPTTPSPPD